MQEKPRKKRREFSKPKVCRFCYDKNQVLDFKNVPLLKNYINKRGKIFARRLSGLCARHQRRVTEEIKKARFIGLLPYVVYIYR